MLSSRRTQALRGLAVAAVTALVPVVAGCEASAAAPTQQWHQPTPGASARVGDITISNLFVLGAPPQSSLPAGSSAGVFLALTNSGAARDRLVGISAPGAARSVHLQQGGITLASQQTALLQGPAPAIILQHTTRPLDGGQDIRMVLDFQRAGSVTLQVPIMPRAGYYTTYSPAPASPTATPSPGAVRKIHGSSSPKPSAAPSPSPS